MQEFGHFGLGLESVDARPDFRRGGNEYVFFFAGVAAYSNCVRRNWSERSPARITKVRNRNALGLEAIHRHRVAARECSAFAPNELDY
jgi:hypothetical protein